jgi:chorismate synthase
LTRRDSTNRIKIAINEPARPTARAVLVWLPFSTCPTLGKEQGKERPMSMNSFGHLFRVTTWGESHGPALGATVDGCPPGVELTPEMLQHWLDRRKPGTSKYTTQRREPDQVKILSGMFEGQSTGTPIQLMIENTDQRSKDYGDIAEKFRPGHADITYWQKYGIRDYRGGGRSSARETAARVAAGGVARAAIQTMAPGVEITGYMTQIGPHKIDRARFDWEQIEQNPFWCPDAQAAVEWADYMDALRKSGNSVGAVVEVVAKGVPAGLGAPIYGKIDTDLAAAMMSINAVKGVEIGEGMNAACLTGEENADEIFMGNDGQPVYSSNHAGGILGGISTGQDLVVRFAVKPTSSILKTRQTITKSGEAAEIITKGRHDPCVGIRAVPVGEAMMACVILDHLLLHRGQIGENQGKIG